MAKSERGGRVFIDWSQNSKTKTTIAPYSLRATATPGVSTPVTWDELADASTPDDLRFTPEEVVTRVDRHGDLLASIVTSPGR
jgi:bifunctional non-homologous end joining protein LigD